MKNLVGRILFATVFLIFAGTAVYAQTDETIVKKKKKLTKTLDIGAGRLWNPDYKDLRNSISYNNLVLKRFGFYTAIEYNKNVANVIGVTASLNNWFYLYGGIDVFTSRGMISRGFAGCRKDSGIAFHVNLPWWANLASPNFLFKAGWSKKVGFITEAGISIPLGLGKTKEITN